MCATTVVIKQFSEIEPVTVDDTEKNEAEPCLSFIINHYYTSHGIPKQDATKLTKRYIKEWVRLATAK